MFGKKDNKKKESNGNGNGANTNFDPNYNPTLDRPKSIAETKAWQTSSKGIGKVWTNYKEALRTSFIKMDRDEQEGLITRASIIVAMGVTALVLSLFYPLIPPLVRIILVPGALVGSWWAGKNFISAVVIGRLEGILNRES